MKFSFALALACASCLNITVALEAAFAQQAEYLQPAQAQLDAAATNAKSEALSPYQIQEEAIRKGLAENASAPEKMAYVPDNNNWNNNTWSNAAKATGSGSKIRGVVNAAGSVLRRTASVAVPTAGVLLLGAAVNRGAMMAMNQRTPFNNSRFGNSGYYNQQGYGQQGFGQTGFNQQGFNQQGLMQQNAWQGNAANVTGSYNPWYTGH